MRQSSEYTSTQLPGLLSAYGTQDPLAIRQSSSSKDDASLPRSLNKIDKPSSQEGTVAKFSSEKDAMPSQVVGYTHFGNGKDILPPQSNADTIPNGQDVLGSPPSDNPYGSLSNKPTSQTTSIMDAEQLSFFKDYYSEDEIHPGDEVSTIWAYQSRAGDEFALERGDMIKVFGIWNDGWATGCRIDKRAEDWATGRNEMASGEIKAFPIVCVCLPEHWRKTIEANGNTETAKDTPEPNPKNSA